MSLKKRFLLPIFLFAASGLLFVIGKWIPSTLPCVSYYQLTTSQAENDISCTGRVERTGSSTVYTNQTGITADVMVSPGDKVEKGQVLAEVQTLPDDIEKSEAVAVYASLLNEESSAGRLENKQLIAPVSGTVSSVTLSPDQIVQSGSPAVVISDGNGIQLRLSVSESQISDIRVGQAVEITGVGFSPSVYHGSVIEIAEEATVSVVGTSQATVVEVLVSVEDPGENLKPGFSAQARIITEQADHALVAPYESVGADEDGTEYVFLYQDGKAIRSDIKTGVEYDSGFEILAGASEGDILLSHPEQWEDGERVRLGEREDAV